MRQRLTSAAGDGAGATRIAALVSFLATLALIVVLSLARSAQAETVPNRGPFPLPASAPAEPEEEGEEEGEESEWESEEEAEEREEAEAAEAGHEPPYECGLRSAKATMVAFESRSKIRLQITYTSFTPGSVKVDYRLHDGRGSMVLGHERKHLGYTGVLTETEKLSKAQMARLLKARELTVELRIPSAPSSCARYATRHLTGKRSGRGRVTWSQPGSIFGT
jgi:hypothetical protein